MVMMMVVMVVRLLGLLDAIVAYDLARQAEVVVERGESDTLQAHDDDLRDAHQVLRVLVEHVDKRLARQAQYGRVFDRFGRHCLIRLGFALFLYLSF